jgi:hypothetical protein
MNEIINVYCDESCQLENDQINVMMLGAVSCPQLRTREISIRIKEIKAEFGLPSDFEIKWTKVSAGQLPFYLHLIDYFFDHEDLKFRGLLIPDKSILNHEQFGQSHDDWYYKMYFQMLKAIFNESNHYRIYIDIKDTLGIQKIEKLHDVLCNSIYDFNKNIIERIQQIRSEESSLLQLADLLIGAVGYHNRALKGSQAKTELIERIKHRSGYSLERSTLVRAEKFNLFRWEGGLHV